MSNIITTLTARIEDYRKENKKPCKNYATETAAERATLEVATIAAQHFAINPSGDTRDADYVVFYIEAWGRWVGAINLTGLLARSDMTGGYLGICSRHGFYSF
tara:strand:+ start:7640 stop:7948 length:309 start_codon:yes stop_codon:yes gene_type:complete